MASCVKQHRAPHTPVRTSQHSHRVAYDSPNMDGDFVVPSFHRYTTRESSRASRQQEVLRQIREPGHSRYHTSQHIIHPGSGTPTHSDSDAGCGQRDPPSATRGRRTTTNSGLRQEPRDITVYEVQSMPITPITSLASEAETVPTLVPPVTNPYLYLPPVPRPRSKKKLWLLGITKEQFFEILNKAEHVGGGIAATTILVILIVRSVKSHGNFTTSNIIVLAVSGAFFGAYLFHKGIRLFLRRDSDKNKEWVEMGDYVHQYSLSQNHTKLLQNPFVRLVPEDTRTLGSGDQGFAMGSVLESGQLALPQPAVFRDLIQNGHQGRTGYGNSEPVQNHTGPSQGNQPVHGGQTVGDGFRPVINEPLVQDWQLVQSPASTTRIGLAQTTSPYTSDLQRREIAKARVEAETAALQRLFNQVQTPGRAVDTNSLTNSNSQGSTHVNEQFSPVSLHGNNKGHSSVAVEYGGSHNSSSGSVADDESRYSDVSDVVELVQPNFNRDTENSSPQASSVYSSQNSLLVEMSPSPEPYSPLSNRPISQVSQQQPLRPPLRSHTTIVTEVGTPESQKTGYRACGGNRNAKVSTNKSRIRQLHESTWSYANEIQQLKTHENQGQQHPQTTPKNKVPSAASQSFGYRHGVDTTSTAPAPATATMTSNEMQYREGTSDNSIGRSNTNRSAASSVRTSEEIRRHRAETLAILCGEPIPGRPPSPPSRNIQASPSSPSYGPLGRGRGQSGGGQRPLPTVPSQIYFRDGRHMTPITEKSEGTPQTENFF